MPPANRGCGRPTWPALLCWSRPACSLLTLQSRVRVADSGVVRYATSMRSRRTLQQQPGHHRTPKQRPNQQQHLCSATLRDRRCQAPTQPSPTRTPRRPPSTCTILDHFLARFGTWPIRPTLNCFDKKHVAPVAASRLLTFLFQPLHGSRNWSARTTKHK